MGSDSNNNISILFKYTLISIFNIYLFVYLFMFFETGSRYVAQDGLQLAIFHSTLTLLSSGIVNVYQQYLAFRVLILYSLTYIKRDLSSFFMYYSCYDNVNSYS
jgi:hypothetical protein